MLNTSQLQNLIISTEYSILILRNKTAKNNNFMQQTISFSSCQVQMRTFHQPRYLDESVVIGDPFS